MKTWHQKALPECHAATAVLIYLEKLAREMCVTYFGAANLNYLALGEIIQLNPILINNFQKQMHNTRGSHSRYTHACHFQMIP